MLRRLWFLAFAAACGGSTPPPVSPLPETQPEPVVATEPAPPVEPAEVPEPPVGPLDVTVPAAAIKLTLVSAGKGTRAPLRYAPKAGETQQVEVTMDFTQKHTAPAELGGSGQAGSPTIVLRGAAATSAVDAAGAASYVLTVTGVDARDVPGAPADTSVPAEQLREALQSAIGLTLTGQLAADGTPAPIVMHVDKGDSLARQVMDMVQLSMPRWPPLPKEPIGVGASWKTSEDTSVLGKLPVTIVTTYKLVARKGATWTITGAIAISGADQQVDKGSISGIKGAGTSEIKLAAGALYPTIKAAQHTDFVASEAGQSIQLSLHTSGAITTAAPAPTAAPTPTK